MVLQKETSKQRGGRGGRRGWSGLAKSLRSPKDAALFLVRFWPGKLREPGPRVGQDVGGSPIRVLKENGLRGGS